MKDNMKSCQHVLSDNTIYKEVVVIGNGPSGMVTSFMLAGNVPYLKKIPDDLPIDEMLKARLSNLPPGQSLYEADLMELAEGLEGRSHNPIPLLMDNLLRPGADMGMQAEPLIEWKFDIEKQIEHIVLGRGPAGGSWVRFPADVRTLSPAAWLTLPPHHSGDPRRLTARAVASYCRRYVRHCRLQRYFKNGVVVTSVTMLPRASVDCDNVNCPLKAVYRVSGYTSSGESTSVACRIVVVSCGAADRPNTLSGLQDNTLAGLQDGQQVGQVAVTDHQMLIDCVNRICQNVPPSRSPPAVLVVGSGVSAADAVRACGGAQCGGAQCGPAQLHTAHAHRAPASALAALDKGTYPDYWQVYKMMCDGPSGNHKNYTPYPDHVILDVTPENTEKSDEEDEIYHYIKPKRVRLLNLVTNQTIELNVSIIAVFIGSKPDLFFLQTNYNLDYYQKCPKCSKESPKSPKRKYDNRQCFLKNHWHYFKSVLGQSIQSCKSRYLNYTEINGNSNTKCLMPDCNKIDDKIDEKDCKFTMYPEAENLKCTCEDNPYTSGIGFGIDPNKPVDGRSNPIAIDKGTHEVLNAPKGIYALGPVTADNFIRFIPGGALAIVSHLHQNRKQ